MDGVLIAIATSALSLVTACQRESAAPQAAQAISLIVSCDTAGWIVPCGCSTKQAGGLLRRGALIDRTAKTAAVIIADVGGAAAGTSPYDIAKFEAILQGELAMGVMAHNLGEAEIKLGREQLHRLSSETKAPFVSANAKGTDAALAPPLVIVERGKTRIALVGVVSPTYATPEIAVSDPMSAVLKVLADHHGQFDSAVVLAYLPTDELEALARSLPEVDLVIGGPTRQSIEPRQVGPVVLAAATNKGKFVARFNTLAGNSPLNWRGEIVELDDAWSDDPAQVANLTEFRKRLGERDFTADETSFVGSLATDLPTDYCVAGTDTCIKCHTTDNDLWHDSTHATAWQTLEKAQHGAHVDSYCQQCHTTGYGLPGGFASIGRSPERVNVGCESCHGPSLAHAKEPREHTTLAAREQCLRCHDRENSPQFSFDEYWPKIEHGAKTAAASAAVGSEEVTQ
jgi:hypothetical protein